MRAYLFPGQGSQRAGMGAGLFERHPALVARASAVLGYPVDEVCLETPIDRLRSTAYTQPALYVVSALHLEEARARDPRPPDYLAGHSLGEYGALHAAGAFEFEEGLELVRIRGELSAAAPPGAMAAVLGLLWTEVEEVLRTEGLDRVWVANYNSPRQLVVTGETAQIEAARDLFEARPGVRYIQLPIRGAFHSPLMEEIATRFVGHLREVRFRAPRIPVISNATALPFPADQPGCFPELLANQLTRSVRWMDSIQYLRGAGVTEFREVGPGEVLAKLQRFILAELPPPRPEAPPPGPRAAAPAPSPAPAGADFREAYGSREAHALGAVEPGLLPVAAVLEAAREGALAFHAPADPADLAALSEAARAGLPVGVSLSQVHEADLDAALAGLAAAGLANVELRDPLAPTPGMRELRARGGRLLVRVARPRVADAFLVPVAGPEGAAEPLASDLAVRVDYTEAVDPGCAGVLLPYLLERRDALRRAGDPAPRVGVGEGVGSPRAVAGAFRQGADFVLTAGIHACTRDARLSEAAKDLLQAAGPDDFVFAPCAADFDLGLRRPVLGRGVLFPRRAQYLHELRRAARDLGELEPWVREVVAARVPVEGGRTDLAALARSYLAGARRAATAGDPGWEADLAVPGEPALGAWNLHVRGTSLADWRARTPARIAAALMAGAADLPGSPGVQ